MYKSVFINGNARNIELKLKLFNFQCFQLIKSQYQKLPMVLIRARIEF